MKYISLIVSLLLINTFGFPQNLEYERYRSDFDDFIKMYNKKYNDLDTYHSKYNTYLENRMLIETIEDDISKLDTYITELWHQFYSMDDGNRRDKFMRPKLDATLSKRRDREEQLKKETENAAKLMRDARLDGALPGWFRNLD